MMLDELRVDDENGPQLRDLRGADMHARGLLAAILAIAGPAIGGVTSASQPSLVVFAASSLTDVLQELSSTYKRNTGQTVKLSFAASSALARQIEAGSPADVFLPADTVWMDYLEERNLIAAGSRRNLLGNRLVLIAPAASKIALDIAPGFAIAAALGDGRLVMGDPAAVPAGRYARRALISLGVWNSVAKRIVPADSVRSVLALIARGEAPLGIVYETDALGQESVRVVGVFPEASHPKIVYPVALTLTARAGSARFANFLGSQQGREIFARYGFQTGE
jgi:molybdate transport system substrate-binding protein